MADITASPPSLLTHQPFKTLFTLTYIAFNTFRLPFWLLYYLPRSLRPSPTYTLNQAIRIRIVRAFLWNAALVRMRVPESLAAGKEKERWVVIQPASPSAEGKERYTGVAACDPSTTPKPIGATWYPAPPAPTTTPNSSSPEDVKAVILHFHGGAYAIGDGRTADAGYGAATQIRNTRASHVLAPQYRLASNGTKFPGQLQDAITAYAYLVFTLGVPPEKVIIAGDSAGGNLALSLLRYLTDEGAASGLPHPAAAFLWSPWPSPVSILKDPGSFHRNANASKDYITGGFGAWGASEMLPRQEVTRKTGVGLEHPAVDFLGDAAEGWEVGSPVWASVGENELLCSDVVRLTEKLREVNGEKVVLDIAKGCPHDYILIGKLLGFDKEANDAAKRAGQWLEGVMA